MNSETYAADAEAKSELVDGELMSCLTSGDSVENLHDVLLYSLGLDIEDRQKRGKRIRPILCLQTCEALGGPIARAIPFACAIELMHNFCLIHDDLEDGDTMRRDRPSVWVKYGEAHAVNSGDYMLTKVFKILSDDPRVDSADLRIKYLQLITDTLDHTHIGQALDINARGRRELSQQDYLRIVEEKTGYYLAAPILGGAMAADAPEGVLQAIRNFGKFIGPLFQVVDDLIDLTDGKGRGERGSDIREGKRSYLVAHVCARADEAEKSRLFDILDLPRAKTTPAHIAEVIALFEKYNTLEEARQYAHHLYDQAMQTLSEVPQNLRDLLDTAFQSLARRKN